MFVVSHIVYADIQSSTLVVVVVVFLGLMDVFCPFSCTNSVGLVDMLL